MKNLYLVETNAFREVVLHDTGEKTAIVLYCAEIQDETFTLKDVEDVSAGEVFEDVDDIIDWLGVSWSDSESPKVIDMIWNWEG